MGRNRLDGVSAMTRKLTTVKTKHPWVVAGALFAEMQIEVTEMKRRTPVDITPDAPHPGNLRNSIHAEEPIVEDRRISCIVATGQQAPYAIFVHENPDAVHPVGQWKFMESVINESRPFMASRIAARIHFDRMTL